MNEPGRDGAAASVASRDPACDDTGLLRRIGQGDADAMASFTASTAGLFSLRSCWWSVTG